MSNTNSNRDSDNANDSNRNSCNSKGKRIKAKPGYLLGREVVIRNKMLKFSNNLNSEPKLFSKGSIILADAQVMMETKKLTEGAPHVPARVLRLQSICDASFGSQGYEDDWCDFCEGSLRVGESQVHVCCICLGHWHEACDSKVRPFLDDNDGDESVYGSARAGALRRLIHERAPRFSPVDIPSVCIRDSATICPFCTMFLSTR